MAPAPAESHPWTSGGGGGSGAFATAAKHGADTEGAETEGLGGRRIVLGTWAGVWEEILLRFKFYKIGQKKRG